MRQWLIWTLKILRFNAAQEMNKQEGWIWLQLMASRSINKVTERRIRMCRTVMSCVKQCNRAWAYNILCAMLCCRCKCKYNPFILVLWSSVPVLVNRHAKVHMYLTYSTLTNPSFHFLSPSHAKWNIYSLKNQILPQFLNRRSSWQYALLTCDRIFLVIHKDK